MIRDSEESGISWLAASTLNSQSHLIRLHENAPDFPVPSLFHACVHKVNWINDFHHLLLLLLILKEKAHPRATVWKNRFLPQDGQLLMTGGGDGRVHLYRKSRVPSQDNSEVAWLMEKIAQEVLTDVAILSLDWNKGFPGLFCSVSADNQLFIGQIGKQ